MRIPCCFLLLSSLLAGCQAQTQTQTVQVKVFAKSSQCVVGNELRQITSTSEIVDILGRKKTLLGDNAPPSYSLNKEKSNYVLVGAGKKPTAGYYFALSQPEAKAQGANLELPLVLKSPAPGAMLAQVVTQPCIVLDIEKGAYTQVKYKGQQLDIQ